MKSKAKFPQKDNPQHQINEQMKCGLKVNQPYPILIKSASLIQIQKNVPESNSALSRGYRTLSSELQGVDEQIRNNSRISLKQPIKRESSLSSQLDQLELNTMCLFTTFQNLNSKLIASSSLGAKNMSAFYRQNHYQYTLDGCQNKIKIINQIQSKITDLTRKIKNCDPNSGDLKFLETQINNNFESYFKPRQIKTTSSISEESDQQDSKVQTNINEKNINTPIKNSTQINAPLKNRNISLKQTSTSASSKNSFIKKTKNKSKTNKLSPESSKIANDEPNLSQNSHKYDKIQESQKKQDKESKVDMYHIQAFDKLISETNIFSESKIEENLKSTRRSRFSESSHPSDIDYIAQNWSKDLMNEDNEFLEVSRPDHQDEEFHRYAAEDFIKMQQKIEELTKELKIAKRERKASQDKIQVQEKQCKQLKHDCKLVQQEYHEIQMIMIELNHNHRQLQNLFKESQNQNMQKEQTIQTLQNQICQKLIENKSLTCIIERKVEEIERFSKKINQKDDEINELHQYIEDFKLLIKKNEQKYKKQYEKYESTIDQLKEELQFCKNSLEETGFNLKLEQAMKIQKIIQEKDRFYEIQMINLRKEFDDLQIKFEQQTKKNAQLLKLKLQKQKKVSIKKQAKLQLIQKTINISTSSNISIKSRKSSNMLVELPLSKVISKKLCLNDKGKLILSLKLVQIGLQLVKNKKKLQSLKPTQFIVSNLHKQSQIFVTRQTAAITDDNEDALIYRAPEVLLGFHQTEFSYVWTICLIIDQIYHQKLFYKKFEEILSHQNNYSFRQIGHKDIADILSSALIKNNKQRPTLMEIKEKLSSLLISYE